MNFRFKNIRDVMKKSSKPDDIAAKTSPSIENANVTRRTLLLGVTTAAAALGLSACSAQQNNTNDSDTSNQNYVSGDGAITEYKIEDRSQPVQFSGKLIDGTQISAEQLRSHVTVINLWYAACAPCRKEAPDLEKIYHENSDKGLKMLGVNIRDEKETAEAFIRKYGITFPIVIDKDGNVTQSLSTYVPPQAVPTTLILDKKGRVASRVMGRCEEATLRSLVSGVVKEQD